MKKSIGFLMVVILIFSIIVALVINFSNVKDLGKSDKIEVIATLFPQYDFAKQIGGDKVNVTLLLPPGAESHTYEPTPQDMIQINNSNLFVYTGKEMEPWAENLISGMKNDINVLDLSTTVKLINTEEFEEKHSEHANHLHDGNEDTEHKHSDKENNVKENSAKEHDSNKQGVEGYTSEAKDGAESEYSSGVAEHEHFEMLEHTENEDHEHSYDNGNEPNYENEREHENEHEHEEEHKHEHGTSEEGHHHEYDPHIWLNPQYAVQMVKSIEQQLSTIDPQNAQYYKNNADNYIKQIQQLDSEFEETVNNSTNKKVAFGGAFAYAYFIERYNLDFISAYETCGESAEPSTAQVKEVIDYINDNKLPVVFYKEYTNGNIAKTIANETGAEMLVFNTVHNVSKQEMADGATYISIMRKNLENLKQALN